MSGAAFDELLRRLAAADVRFVLVGGFAVNAWGVVRGTKDLDIVIEQSSANFERLAGVAVALGGTVQGSESLAGSEHSIAALLATGERVLIQTRLGPIDVVQGLEGVPSYEHLVRRAVKVEILGTDVPVCSLEDLRAMKRAAGRPRDKVDLDDLDEAHRSV